ncbi:helix-turn-helix domain-containing protein [Nocardiopsis lambiniae]|uniref:Helix-turn-helix domain-containing protein n=1 Tax=Nocardiopsis lambiniae TaxID=3075539 RepID=A0ABU2M737_9ACTN|nr:helix-turn-helix domain-containing protein [Nocardiopsis sp. DSM 44743]MDT0328484.1 helix-turn-helix domain-containing protein [Nocardiopsis sp. DSM 44743]
MTHQNSRPMRWLSIAQVADLWGVAQDTVENWVRRDWIAHVTDHGGRYRIPEAAAEAVIDEMDAARSARDETRNR